MSDHPSTIEGALKWAKVAAECFGDEPPDMDSVAIQTLAAGYLSLRARAEKAEAALRRIMSAAGHPNPADGCRIIIAIAQEALAPQAPGAKGESGEAREMLVEIVSLCQEMAYSTTCPAADSIRHIGNVGRIERLARALLARKPAEETPLARKLVEVYNRRLPGCDCPRCTTAASEPSEERGPEVGE